MGRHDRSEGQRGRDGVREEGRCIFSGRKCSRAKYNCAFNRGRGGSRVDVCRYGIQWGLSSCRHCSERGRCAEVFKCFLEE